jgi:tRNA(Ile)-lysidine synthase TilS/MesJ
MFQLGIAIMKYIRNVLAALRKADRDFSLIDEGDKILVGLSGGKDSLSLLRALSVYGKFAGKNFTVRPVYLDLGFANVDLDGLKAYVSSLGYDLYVSDSRFVYDVLKAHTKEGHHIPCSICSRMKKAAMNNIAHELGFSKVAFAHHNDDAVETLFMNMVHGGRVATFEPKMTLERAGITFIRPLIYARESDLKNLALEENMPVLSTGCPANGHTERETTKEFLEQVYHSHPEARDNFRSMLSNYEPFQLYFNDIEMENEKDHSYALKPMIFADDIRGSLISEKRKKIGEKDFLILHKHLKCGEISYLHLNDHRIMLFNISGDKNSQLMGISSLIHLISRDVNPVTFVLSGARNDIAIEAGFIKKEEPGIKLPHYILRIKK